MHLRGRLVARKAIDVRLSLGSVDSVSRESWIGLSNPHVLPHPSLDDNGYFDPVHRRSP